MGFNGFHICTEVDSIGLTRILIDLVLFYSFKSTQNLGSRDMKVSEKKKQFLKINFYESS